MALTSTHYQINEGPKYLKSINKFFSKTPPQSIELDIQKLFDQLDYIFRDAVVWGDLSDKICTLPFKKESYRLCKAYIPISHQRLSPKRGARLFLAKDDTAKKIFLILVMPKTMISAGSRRDLSDAEYKKLINGF